MKCLLRFRGACQAVTGSCYEIETAGSRIIIDCGLFQGSKSERELNYGVFPFDPRAIDAAILTHAHIDHSGLIPKLVRQGFAAPIYATTATVDLCSIMLADSAHIQEMEVSQLNRRNAQRGRPVVSPIYTPADAAAAMPLFRCSAYGQWLQVTADIRARFWNAGHMLGSASVELEISGEMDERQRVLFSGDIGPNHKLLQPDASGPSLLDYVVCESTYGDRERGDVNSLTRRALLQAEVQAAVVADGPLIIPSFAVERTQEILVDLHMLIKDGHVPAAPIFVDSPLATRASEIFRRHAGEIEAGELLVRALESTNIRFTETVEQSKAINRLSGFYIVIAASGMCDAGRIRHHLKANLWRRNATVLMAGFQAQGSLGRILIDGARRVRIQGEEVRVNARIRLIDLYSGHADASELAAWVSQRLPIAKSVFLTHGELPALLALRQNLETNVTKAQVIVPELDDVFDLAPAKPRQVEDNESRRLLPANVARLDWHNDLSKLMLDLSETLETQAEENSRARMIRRLRRVLEGENDTTMQSEKRSPAGRSKRHGQGQARATRTPR